jgi:hypothetical protein
MMKEYMVTAEGRSANEVGAVETGSIGAEGVSESEGIKRIKQ